MMQIPMYDALDEPPKSATQEKLPPASAGPCAWCGGFTEGHYWIHRDGIGVGPTRPLCNDHGGFKNPTAKMIRQKLRIEASIG
jgi:hypothetical protein